MTRLYGLFLVTDKESLSKISFAHAIEQNLNGIEIFGMTSK